MPLTPADIHNVAFKKPPIGKRGYDEEEVDAFLDVFPEFPRERVVLSPNGYNQDVFRPLPDGVTDLDHFRVQRRDRAGGVIHEYRLVA